MASSAEDSQVSGVLVEHALVRAVMHVETIDPVANLTTMPSAPKCGLSALLPCW